MTWERLPLLPNVIQRIYIEAGNQTRHTHCPTLAYHYSPCAVSDVCKRCSVYQFTVGKHSFGLSRKHATNIRETAVVPENTASTFPPNSVRCRTEEE